MTRSGWNPIPLAGGWFGVGLRGCQRHRVRNASATAICLLGSPCSCRRGPFHRASRTIKGTRTAAKRILLGDRPEHHPALAQAIRAACFPSAVADSIRISSGRIPSFLKAVQSENVYPRKQKGTQHRGLNTIFSGLSCLQGSLSRLFVVHRDFELVVPRIFLTSWIAA
jgi:hypothetical protein